MLVDFDNPLSPSPPIHHSPIYAQPSFFPKKAAGSEGRLMALLLLASSGVEVLSGTLEQVCGIKK